MNVLAQDTALGGRHGWMSGNFMQWPQSLGRKVCRVIDEEVK